MKFSDLLRKTAPLAVPYRGETVNIVYKTEVLTPEYRAQLGLIGRSRPLELDERATLLALTEGADALNVDELRARLAAVRSVATTSDKKDEKREADAKLLSDLLVSWDVLDDGEFDGEVCVREPQPIPTDYETLMRCSDGFMATLGKAMLADIANPTNAAS